MFWLTLLAFLVILSLLVFVHELGHFVVAKLSKVEVEEFAFGFPPRLFGFQVFKSKKPKEIVTHEEIKIEIEDVKSGTTERIEETITEDSKTSEKVRSQTIWKFAWGHRAVSKLVELGAKNHQTTYCINAIPFGGYVKMLGEEDNSSSPRAFVNKKARFRFAIVIAGVLMNLILAGVLLSIGYMVGTTPIRLDPARLSGSQTAEVTIAEVQDNTPARVAGLKVGDIILNYNSATDFSAFTHSNLGQQINLTVSRDNQILNKDVVLGSSSDAPLGAGVVDIIKVKLPFFRAIAAGFEDAFLTTGYIVVLLWQFITHIFVPGEVANNVAGPVKIFNITGEAVKMGFGYLIQFAALLSINVALVNILPLPALDGGRAVLIFAEGVFRRKVIKTEFENLLHMIGFIVLMVLVVAVTLREIIALF